ncbi:hypothetical protein Ancab_015598 [Ancistrocladus abbreviatus]
MDPDLGSEQVKGTTVTLGVPAIILNNMQASMAVWEYYDSMTYRSRSGRGVAFTATARILDGRQATYTGQAPIVAACSCRGPDVNNALLQTADVLKPTFMAPVPPSGLQGAKTVKVIAILEAFTLVSGTSMAIPHVAGVAALIKQRNLKWKPSAIISAMMTTADVVDQFGNPILAEEANQLTSANPFDYGAGSINPFHALDPGLVFIAQFRHYIQFLCVVPGVDDESVRRAIGVGCPTKRKERCSDLNTPSVTISNLIGSRTMTRIVTNVAEFEKYHVAVTEPEGVKIKVTPQMFNISANATRHLKLMIEATELTNAYNIGELLLRGSKKHVIRVPIAVYVNSVLGS